MAELGRSDRQVGELTRALKRPSNLISYHLGRLRAEGLVSARRSSADGRGAYYSLDVARCGALLAAAGGDLHPSLRGTGRPPVRSGKRRDSTRVLFTCTGNSARSQFAEAFVRQLGSPGVFAVSAGSHPKDVHPNAIRVGATYGLDLSGARSKPLAEFEGQSFDYVVTLCDRVREVCPQFSGGPELIHWSVPDPSAGSLDDDERYAVFEGVAADIRSRVTFLLDRIQQDVNEKCMNERGDANAR